MPKAAARAAVSLAAPSATTAAKSASATATAAAAEKRTAPGAGLSPVQRALRKLGLLRDIDFALYLPMRYEDETRIARLADVRDFEQAQIEGVVVDCELVFRPRRQLIATIDDGSGTCQLRLFNFYPSQQKQLAVGARVRARGEIRGGFLPLGRPNSGSALAGGSGPRAAWERGGVMSARTMLHPTIKAAGTALPEALTPVYSSIAGLAQPLLRREVRAGLARAALDETIPCQIGVEPAWNLRNSLSFLHYPAPDVALETLEDRSHPAWQHIKAEELLAQQLSQLMARRERAAQRAPVLDAIQPTQRLQADSDGSPAVPGAPVASVAPAAPVAPAATAASTASTASTAPAAHPAPHTSPSPFQSTNPSLHAQLLAVLPFGLTGAQQRVGDEIRRDLARDVPMHRLLQGDVGSGKTVVAALAAAIAIDAGFQCALMAPTEILAAQHFSKLVGWLDPLLAERGLRVAWLTGSQKKKERDAMMAAVESGAAALVIGTHAVISQKVRFRNLALAIIDEQHRFGVAQRLALRGKAANSAPGDKAVNPSRGRQVPSQAPDDNAAYTGDAPTATAAGASAPRAPSPTVALEPHLLMMSATPIPRTLAMSYYADLDVSTLDELPPGRTPIVTKLVADHRRDEVVARIQAQLAQGRQVYWVCPLIEDSEAVDLRNATETHEELAQTLGPGVNVGLLHSRMPTAEKAAVMAAFTANAVQVLVSTTVIEVGVDVPNASLMVIEHAERFGLSQLHQLRGRVGRGAAASACVLLYAPGDSGRVGETARARLKAMAETGDGFEIARRDLDIRGPGEFLGARQSGAPLLRFADLTTDALLLDWARELAPKMLDEHPELAQKHVDRWLGSKAEYLKA